MKEPKQEKISNNVNNTKKLAYEYNTKILLIKWFLNKIKKLNLLYVFVKINIMKLVNYY